MSGHGHEPLDIHSETRRADGLLTKVFVAGGLVGLAALGATFLGSYLLAKDGLRHFAHSYLVSYAYFASLMLGALFFVIVHHLTRSGWSVVVRRIAELFAANVAVMAALILPVLALSGVLFPWTGPERAELEHLPGIKAAYLSMPFFLARCAFYFVAWAWLGYRFFSRSVRQDRTGDPSETTGLERFSPVAIILFAITVTFFSFDFLMSLAPMWFSTMFGVYYFAGSVAGFMALFGIVCVFLQRNGILKRAITTEHYHDIGKLLFAFVVFWAYIAFSQYMLIWYANIPEETAWYAPRHTGQWGAVGLLLVAGHFAIPFIGLMPRASKRRKAALVFWSVWILVMHYADLYWIAMPQFSPGHVPLGLVDLGCFLGIGGLFVAGAAYTARGRSLVPERDPRLHESLAFENA